MAMSLIWTGMLLTAVVCGIVNGQGAALASAAMEGAQNAVRIALSIAGPICLWSGFGVLLQKSGVGRLLEWLLHPVLCRLFPSACKDKEAAGAISANVTANMLGLGNAATPMGIAAVRRMKALSGQQSASDEMCRLIVLNTASLQLLPTGVAALRASAGAAAPFDILPAVWLTSVCSVSAGLLAAYLLRGVRR